MTDDVRPRKLKWYETDKFSGWGCTGCGWYIVSAATASDKIVKKLVNEAFDRHRCKGHPRRKESFGSRPD